jgi:flagellar FliJ protein
MARFSFNLDPVLEHRHRLEQEQQVALAAALMRLRDAERYRDALISRRDSMRVELTQRHGQMDLTELRATYTHCAYLDREITQQHDVVDGARRAADLERDKLVALTKDKKVLETLKTRRREAFEAEAALVEQNQLDDINARIFDRASREISR